MRQSLHLLGVTQYQLGLKCRAQEHLGVKGAADFLRDVFVTSPHLWYPKSVGAVWDCLTSPQHLEPLNAPFLNGLFASGFSRGKTAP